MKQVAIIIIVLVIAAAAYLVFTLSPRQVTPKDIHPVPGLVRASQPASEIEKPVDTTAVSQQNAETRTDSVQERQQVQVQSLPEVPAPAAGNDGNYYIIIESFKNTRAAEERADYLEKKLAAEIVVLPPTPAGICRLSYGRYTTFEAAETALIKVRIKIRPEAWILSPAK
jgi:hypothetical protein